jgi:hypothetical protein
MLPLRRSTSTVRGEFDQVARLQHADPIRPWEDISCDGAHDQGGKPIAPYVQACPSLR